MEAALIIAIISALGSVIAAVTSYYFSRKREIEADWRNQKLTAYKELLAGLSDAAIGGSTILQRKSDLRTLSTRSPWLLRSQLLRDFSSFMTKYESAILVRYLADMMNCSRIYFWK